MTSTSEHAPPSSTLIGGKYELVKMIGRGGMGSVWEGRHQSLGTSVAIKFIDKEFAESGEARQRFDNEARAAAAIQSKHAIQIHDHGVTDDGRPFIVMEMLRGEPLDKRLERTQRMSLQETARMIHQVCRALARAHNKHIVHRDLKPENIFLVHGPDDDEAVAKVLDFGIAKIRNADGQSLTNSTKTGAVLGTPYYMSPEQARGLRSIDHRSDLWSLGVIVFRCVTGTLPFDGESLGDLLVKICTSPVPVPSERLPGLPPAFDAWFARAMAREPGERFSSAQELSEALAFACGISLGGQPRSSLAGAAGALGGALASSGGLAQTPQPSAANAASQGHSGTSAPFTSSGQRRAGGGSVLWIGGLAFLVIVGAGGAAVYRFSQTKTAAVVEPAGEETAPPKKVKAPAAQPAANTVTTEPDKPGKRLPNEEPSPPPAATEAETPKKPAKHKPTSAKPHQSAKPTADKPKPTAAKPTTKPTAPKPTATTPASPVTEPGW